MMKKLIVITCFAICLVLTLALSARTIQETTTIDASQRNQIESSGGGSSFDSTLSYNFSGNNTFSGVSNLHTSLEYFTTNVFIYGTLGLNTNGVNPAGGYTYVIRPAPSQTSGGILVKSPTGGNAIFQASLDSGEFFGTDFTSGAWRFDGSGGSLSEAYFRINNGIILRLAQTSVTLGEGSNSQLLFNGATHTIAHTPQVNTDVWKWASAGGTLTNGTSLVVLNTLTVSNLVVQGSSTLDTGTNATATIRVNGGAGQLITAANYLFATNTESSTAYAVNTIYTNGNQRMLFDANLVFNANSAAFFYTVSGSQTNIFSRKFYAAAGTNNITGFVQPNGTYVISNYVGTVTPLLGEFNRILQ
jgi:hypothetical protein